MRDYVDKIQTAICSGGYDRGEALGEDRGLYHPHAHWQCRPAALQHRRQHCGGKVCGGQCPGGRGKRKPYAEPSSGVICGYIHGSQHHGVPVFRLQGQGESVPDHRKHHHADRGGFRFSYGFRVHDYSACAAHAQHAGQYYRLVRLLPVYSPHGNRRSGLLQYSLRRAAGAGGFPVSPGVPACGHRH